MRLYKILVDGGSCHGGQLEWSLPVRNPKTGKYRPGAWQTVNGDISACWNALHLTDDPARWGAGKMTFYDANLPDLQADNERRNNEIDRRRNMAKPDPRPGSDLVFTVNAEAVCSALAGLDPEPRPAQIAQFFRAERRTLNDRIAQEIGDALREAFLDWNGQPRPATGEDW